MKIAIRDDDTCFFTRPEDIKQAYSFVTKGCVSLSIIPYAYPIHKDDVFPYGENISPGYYDISNNIQLIDHIRQGVREEKYEILLHGFTHEYKKIGDDWKAEMIWKDRDQMEKELKKGRKLLENYFDTKVSVFVAPNNDINQKCEEVLDRLGLDYSGKIKLHRVDRKIDFYYIKNYLNMLFYRLNNHQTSSGVYKYKNHCEQNAFDIVNFETSIEQYELCKKKGKPFIVYTHYWYLLKNKNYRDILMNIYEYCMNDGAELVGVTKLMQEGK